MLKTLSWVLIGFSTLGVLSVSLMAFVNPQSVMDLIQTQLPNNDALSSIRGVYGGAGFTIAITMLVLARKDMQWALLFISLLWGSYAFSRLMTILADGPLGAFGNQWIITESFFAISAIALYSLQMQRNQIQLSPR